MKTYGYVPFGAVLENKNDWKLFENISTLEAENEIDAESKMFKEVNRQVDEILAKYKVFLVSAEDRDSISLFYIKDNTIKNYVILSPKYYDHSPVVSTPSTIDFSDFYKIQNKIHARLNVHRAKCCKIYRNNMYTKDEKFYETGFILDSEVFSKHYNNIELDFSKIEIGATKIVNFNFNNEFLLAVSLNIESDTLDFISERDKNQFLSSCYRKYLEKTKIVKEEYSVILNYINSRTEADQAAIKLLAEVDE